MCGDSMRITAAKDSIFRLAEEGHVPWSPEPDRSVYYMDDKDWQKHHLWDHHTESDNGAFGPYRGPTILHHPDAQHALDNGWRFIGGDKAIDHQSRGETGSGSPYMYKISRDGTIHSAHLNVGPDESIPYDQDGHETDFEWGSVPENNWRHLIMGEGGTAEGPKSHESLKDLVDDEAFRSSDPTHKGYSDFNILPYFQKKQTPEDMEWSKKYQHIVRRAWETGTNRPHDHWKDPIPDPYAHLDDIPRGPRRPRRQEPVDYEY